MMSLKPYFQSFRKIRFQNLRIKDGDRFFVYMGHKTCLGYVAISCVDVLKDGIVFEGYENENATKTISKKLNQEELKEYVDKAIEQLGLNAATKYISRFKEEDIGDLKKLTKFFIYCYTELQKIKLPDYDTETIYESKSGKQLRLSLK